MPYFYYNDPYIILLLVVMAFASIAQMKVSSTFSRYSTVLSKRGMTGASCARTILDRYGAHDVRIEPIPGKLTDYYDPSNKVLRLSEEVYQSTSVSALGVAAHECGHAIQHAAGYFPMKVRSAIVPATRIGSNLSWPIMLLGILFSFYPLAVAGVILFSACVFFQLVTLPVEFNASNRALKILDETGILTGDEVQMTKKVLSAAAMTYVAALAASIVQLLRLISIANRGRRNN